MLSHEYAIVELDIVESLRNHAKDRDIDAWMNCEDAADEIERLREEIERLREAANDLAQYVSRADWYHYVKPETRAALREKE